MISLIHYFQQQAHLYYLYTRIRMCPQTENSNYGNLIKAYVPLNDNSDWSTVWWRHQFLFDLLAHCLLTHHFLGYHTWLLHFLPLSWMWSMTVCLDWHYLFLFDVQLWTDMVRAPDSILLILSSFLYIYPTTLMLSGQFVPRTASPLGKFQSVWQLVWWWGFLVPQ